MRCNFALAGSKVAAFVCAGASAVIWRCRPALVQRALGSSGQVCSQLVDPGQGGRELRAHALQLDAKIGIICHDGIELGRARGGGHPRHVARMVAQQHAAVGQDPEADPCNRTPLPQAPLRRWWPNDGRRRRRGRSRDEGPPQG